MGVEGWDSLLFPDTVPLAAVPLFNTKVLFRCTGVTLPPLPRPRPLDALYDGSPRVGAILLLLAFE